MNEVWHPVVGYEGFYEVSDQGRVRSVDRITTSFNGKAFYQRTIRSKVLKPLHGTRYLHVALHKNGAQATKTIHTLVAEAFLGPRPTDQQVRHGPAGRYCNALANLSYGTAVENAGDKLRDGTHSRGKNSYRWSGLSEKVVLAIYNAPKSRGCNRRLAEAFETTEANVKNIRLGKSWSWLTGAG